MRFLFCKNSVFCVLFGIAYLLGTICGTFLFGWMYTDDYSWLTAYGSAIDCLPTDNLILFGWLHAVPFLAVISCAFLSIGRKLLFVLIFLRGCISCYTAAVYWASYLPVREWLLLNIFLLPLYYALSRYVWGMHSEMIS